MKLYHNEKNSSMAVWQSSTTLWLHDGGLTVLGDSRCSFGGESAFSLQKKSCTRQFESKLSLRSFAFSLQKICCIVLNKVVIMRKSKEAPFVFGVRVEGDSFTDRREETERLKANFTYGVNTILISPRRMGKTSLVDKVCSLVESEDIRIARIDAFGCRSENDFINAFATAVVRATSSKWEEWMENAKVFLSRFVPKISIGQDPLTDFSLEYNAGNNTTEEVLRLPEMIARSKGCHIVVCIDEFQQIGDFPDSLTFQKKLRSVWQLQSHVSYCLYGSKKHMMEQMFQNASYPLSSGYCCQCNPPQEVLDGERSDYNTCS